MHSPLPDSTTQTSFHQKGKRCQKTLDSPACRLRLVQVTLPVPCEAVSHLPRRGETKGSRTESEDTCCSWKLAEVSLDNYIFLPRRQKKSQRGLRAEPEGSYRAVDPSGTLDHRAQKWAKGKGPAEELGITITPGGCVWPLYLSCVF